MEGHRILKNILDTLIATLELKSWNIYESNNGAVCTLRFRDNSGDCDNTNNEPRIASYKKKSQAQIARDKRRMKEFNRPFTRSQTNTPNANDNIEIMRHCDESLISEPELSPATVISEDLPTPSPLRPVASPPAFDKSMDLTDTVKQISYMDSSSADNAPDISLPHDTDDKAISDDLNFSPEAGQIVKTHTDSDNTHSLLQQHISKRPAIRYKDIMCYECAHEIHTSERMLFCNNCTLHTCKDCNFYNSDKYPCCDKQSLEFITRTLE